MGKPVQWAALKDGDGNNITVKMPLMMAHESHTAHIYIRTTPLVENPVLHVRWVEWYVHYHAIT